MAITAGPNLNSVPAAQQATLSTNYLDFTSGTNDWAQQYLPDLMEAEAEVFGNRTISGFLSQVGAEEAMTSDQVVWSEQGRLHLSYKGKTTSTTVVLIQGDIDDAKFNPSGISTGLTGTHHGIRVNDTVIIANSVEVVKALVKTISGDSITIDPYEATAITNATGTSGDKDCRILVYGSEFGKGKTYGNVASGANTSRGANEPDFKSFSNKPVILKDYYEVSGSDASRIGWVEVTGEDGQNGYLWYLKAQGDTRSRFTDYIEMAMIEGIEGVPGSSNADDQINGAGNSFGTQGLFAAIEDRGNLTSGVTGISCSTDLAEFDAILAEFDKQGAIEENMMFVNRATSLAIDDMLACMNSYGAGGTSYGVFNNSEDMALNLGFSGFRRGSYDFYKSDFRYLNDLATRGAINEINATSAIRGVIIPAGTSSVYDQTLGKNLKRPFLHVRYRASQTDDRRMKTWVTGSVGAATSALDAMEVHMLSERCLITQGANNFMLMK